mmetsp:Transcript_6763/g.17311  ORF Transcript_6763/g.17311 Transcript_6763/m.17311 type:complete len:642 (-) Transcript_6763:269-2194(-)
MHIIITRRRRRALEVLLVVVVAADAVRRHERGEVEALGHELVVVAHLRHAALLEHHHAVGARQVLQRVGHQHARVLAQHAVRTQHLLEQRAAHVVVHGAQRVVQQVHVGVGVHGARDGHALLLPAAQRHPALADHRGVLGRQDVQVRPQLAHAQARLVLHLVVGLTEQDVVAHRAVEDPGLLRHVRHAARHLQGAGGLGHEGIDGGQQGGLAAPHAPDDHAQGPRGEVQVEVVQLERRLLRLLRVHRHLIRGGSSGVFSITTLLGGGISRRLLLGGILRRRLLDGGPAEGGVGHLDAAGVGHVGRHLGALVLDKERAEALHGAQRVEQRGEQEGHQDEWEAQHVEERQGGVRRGRRQRVAGQREAAQGAHGDEHGRGEQRDAEQRARLLALPDERHLLGADGADARGEGALPSVVLDDAHAVDHLAQDVDAAVRALHQLLADAEQLGGDEERAGRRHDDAQEADEGAPLDDVVQHHEGAHDEDGRAPQVVQQLEQILQLVDVVGHQRHDLAGGLLLQALRGQPQALAVQRAHQPVAHAHAQPLQRVVALRLAEVLKHPRRRHQQRVEVHLVHVGAARGGGAEAAGRRGLAALDALHDGAQQHGAREEAQLRDGVQHAGAHEQRAAAHQARARQAGLGLLEF